MSCQFARHFAIFRVAASRISHVSSILRLFLSILPSCLASLIFVSFQSIICWSHFAIFRTADLMLSFDFTAFWFHFANLCSVRDGKQGGKSDSQISVLHFAQLFPQWFTSFLDMSISFLKIDLQ